MTGDALSRRRFLRGGVTVVAAAAGAPLLAGCDPKPSDRPAWRQSFTTPGSLDVTVVDAGGWCWFSESRSLITPGGRLYVGSVASGTGTARDGAIEITSIDVRNGVRPGATRRTTLDPAPRAAVGWHRVDDHNNPGLELTGGGGVVGMWSGHGTDTLLRRTIDVAGTGAFTEQQPIDRPDSVIAPGRGVSYGSVHRLSTGLLMAAYRGEQYSWNLMRSADQGASWEPMGLLLVPPSRGERPYAKFAAAGDRLLFACTEGHPRTYQPTNIRVGAVDVAGAISTVAGSPLGTVGPGVSVLNLPMAYRCPANADAWISEIRIVAGRPVLSVSVRGARVDTAAGAWAHDQLRVMPDPTGVWVRELVARGGGELGENLVEPDYSGLAAVDPSTHNRFVVATNVHPLTNVPLVSRADGKVHFELWEMNRLTDGSSRWSATYLTRDSREDHIRPHIALSGGTKILSWMAGRYRNPHDYRTRIVARQSA